MVLIAVYNPVSGDRRAKSVLLQHTLPLLTSHSIPINGVFATEHTSHAGQIVSDIIKKSGERRIQVVLCSGDGTLHDIINGISVEVDAVEFILVPCGTANALYSSLFPPNSSQPNDSAYMLQSIHSYLRMSHTRPLYVAVNTISSSASASPIEVLSTVVTSTCLHASILRDSEGLREEFPGVDRFVVNFFAF
jgi:diacylglycerol kinase family enzyme